MRMLALLAISSPLFSQGVSLGLRSGVLVTSLLTAESPQRTSASRFTIGPCLEIHLWRGAGFGLDLLFRRAYLADSSAGSRHARIQEWELPATFVYRFRRPLGPFFRTGISFNRVFDISSANECAQGPFGERFYCLAGSPLVELRHSGTSGFVLGGGIRKRLHGLWIEPEVRWTHWIDRNFGVRDSTVHSNLNQIGFLVGLLL
jgi:hypothetical protein